MKKRATKAEREHLNLIASMPCIVCGLKPVHVHHVAGHGMRASHYDTLPLCARHHLDGNLGVAVHSGRRSFEANFGTERELLAKVNKLISISFV